jgi:hypothetical protein
MREGRLRTGTCPLQQRLPTWRITELEAESMFSIITCSMEPRVSLQHNIQYRNCSNKKCDWKRWWAARRQPGWQNRLS